METKLFHYIKAGYPIVWVRTSEDVRAVEHILASVEEAGLSGHWIGEWRVNTGLTVDGKGKQEGDTIPKAVSYLVKEAQAESKGILIIHNIRQFIGNFQVIQEIKDAAMVIRTKSSYIFLVGADITIPPELLGLLTVYDYPLPTKEQFTKLYTGLCDKYAASLELPAKKKDKELEIEKASDAALGMTYLQGENAMALSFVKSRSIDMPVLFQEKEQAIRQSDVLELVQVTENFDQLGGFDLFKPWIQRRARAFTPEAKKYGLRPPRGVLIAGVAGCLSGDTLIPVCRKKRGGGHTKIRLEELWYRFNGKHAEGVAAGVISKAKRVWDAQYTTKALSYKEEEGYIGWNEVTGVVYSGIKTLYEIITDYGVHLQATKDHEICTPNGYVPLESLKKGDSILSYRKGKLLYDNKHGRNRNKQWMVINNVGRHPNARIRQIKSLQYSSHPMSRLVFEADMNNMPLEDFLAQLQEDVSKLLFLNPDIEIHHKDENRFNNRLDNLEVLSKADHARLHMLSNGHKLHKYINGPRVQKIASIEEIEDKPTYDIKMADPYRNMVADGIVVHNCGKSLCAKVIAGYMQIPLIKFDVGKVFRSLQGQSEQAVRTALKTVEAVAPAVLWVDELEKSMAGSDSSGRTDSGTTARVMQSILTWMQEKTCAAFVAATVNNIDNIPPELLRKGRFDEVWGVDLPADQERADIFGIHIRKRSRDPKNFDIAALIPVSQWYTGAEIEAGIEDAMYFAYADNAREFTTEDIIRSLEETTPQCKTQSEKISVIRDWIADRARLVSSHTVGRWGAKTSIAVEELRKLEVGEDPKL